MLRLGRLTDYAVTLLSHMETTGKAAVWSAPGLAEKSGIPAPTAAKVLKLLAKGRLITAQRGPAGGYKLARPSAEITIAEIIEVMDGPIALTNCAAKGKRKTCKIQRLCPLSLGWNKVNVAVRDALKNVSLAEMFSPPLLDQKDGARPFEGES